MAVYLQRMSLINQMDEGVFYLKIDFMVALMLEIQVAISGISHSQHLQFSLPRLIEP